MMEWSRGLYRKVIRDAIDSGEFHCEDPFVKTRPQTRSELAIRRAQTFLRDKSYDLSGFSPNPGHGHWDVFQRFGIEHFGIKYMHLEKSAHNFFFEDQAYRPIPDAHLHHFGVRNMSELMDDASRIVERLGLTPIFHHPSSVFFAITRGSVTRQVEYRHAKKIALRSNMELEKALVTSENQSLFSRSAILSGTHAQSSTACAHCIWRFDTEEELSQHLHSNPDCMVFMVTNQ